MRGWDVGAVWSGPNCVVCQSLKALYDALDIHKLYKILYIFHDRDHRHRRHRTEALLVRVVAPVVERAKAMAMACVVHNRKVTLP